jgi:hypothetical protein
MKVGEREMAAGVCGGRQLPHPTLELMPLARLCSRSMREQGPFRAGLCCCGRLRECVSGCVSVRARAPHLRRLLWLGLVLGVVLVLTVCVEDVDAAKKKASCAARVAPRPRAFRRVGSRAHTVSLRLPFPALDRSEPV